MTEAVRATYRRASHAAVALIGRRELGDRWNDPSVLEQLTIGQLAAHLARAVLQVEWYLDLPEPDPPTISAVEYYAALVGTDDLASELNVRVRARAEETASVGWARLYLDVSRTLERLEERLVQLPGERRIHALGRPLLVDEYLKTRVVEIVVHIDDLCRSLEIDVPALSPETGTVAVAVLVGAARARHGDTAVLHALTRRELDEVEALRVL